MVKNLSNKLLIGKILAIGIITIILFVFIIDENDISRSVTGITFKDVVNQIDDTSTPTDEIINIETKNIETRNIDDFCDTKLPNGFTNVLLNYDNVLSSGMCFPIENLQIFSCSQKKLIDGSIQQICIADIFLSDRSGIFNGLQTDSNGLAFIELDCEVGNKWAECEDHRGFALLSFLP